MNERQYSNLLINEPPLQVVPSLAIAIGLEEAIVLQQLHYWLQKRGGENFNGFHWVYNTYEEWHTGNFPFWSLSTVKRIFKRLEEMGLVKSMQSHKGNWDHTKSYTIDYYRLHTINGNAVSPSSTQTEAAIEYLESVRNEGIARSQALNKLDDASLVLS